ncbi:hypothetical protein JCM16303_003862 [Sporobolomyces ruberrimus]
MHRNSYDNDNSTFSPQGRLHQVEYALEAVKQGSACVGLRSDTHVILLGLKRSTGELASYQKKLIRIDDHLGIAIAGLTSDARVLSNFMRTQAMSSRMVYNRPLPVSRIVGAIADKAQINTQHYGHRPYGVGLLVAGYDDKGPHLYEFSPSGNCLEYYAMSIGARSQSAKTYLESNFEKFPSSTLEELIGHGLNALRDTLQQDKELTVENTSIGIVGLGLGKELTDEESNKKEGPEGIKVEQPPSGTPTALGEQMGSRTKKEQEEFHKFKIVEGEELGKYLSLMAPKEEEGEGEGAAGGPVQERPATDVAGGDAPAPSGEEMQTD